MTRTTILARKKLQYKVLDLQGKELTKTYSKKVATAYAYLIGGLVTGIR